MNPTLPAWDLTPLYKGPNDPKLKADIGEMKIWGESTMKRVEQDPLNPDLWESLILEREAVYGDLSHLSCYVSNAYALRPQDPEMQNLQWQRSQLGNDLGVVNSAFNAFLQSMDERQFHVFKARPKLKEIGFFLDQSYIQASRRMDPALENFGNELDMSGANLWGDLYFRSISGLKFTANIRGEEKEFSMSQRRTLTEDPSPDIRKEVFHKSNAEMKKQEATFAFCLNGIVGSRLTKMKHRRRSNFLETGLSQSRIGEESVRAMWSACEHIKPELHRYMKWKGQKQGRPFGYYDMDAPIGKESEGRISWDQAWTMITEAFKVYPRLLDYAQDLVKNGQIDATLDPQKSPGGFCSGSKKIKKSYVYLNYGGSMGDVLTVAHEIGHAFHSDVIKDERYYNIMYPMTLAETASTFAEALMNQTLLKSSLLSSAQKFELQISELNRHCAFLIDIPTRFDFETSFHEERKAGFVPASRITELMIAAQKKWWGEWIDEKELDPCFWISKGHFYIVGTEFYNYPYTVGFLLSRLLAEGFLADPQGFQKVYEDFLMKTGRMSVEDLVKDVLGEDTRDPKFWLKGMAGFAPTLKEVLS